MNDLILHPVTRQQIDDFIRSPSHALLLIGSTGSGKSSLAAGVAETVLDLPNGLETYAYKMVVSAAEGSISIDTVRQLERFLSLKVPRAAPYNRAIIIENAQALTTEAQNALLKTLEEPPAATLIILTVSHAQALLPTIQSRAQSINVKKPSQASLNQHFQSQGHEGKQIKQAYAISGGLPGLMQALLSQAEHPLLQATEQARQFLRASSYERLLMVDELAKQRELAKDTALILQQMAHVSLQTASGRTAKRWQAIMAAAFEAANQLNHSAQPKLALTNLALAF